jgi:hypothetical protein
MTPLRVKQKLLEARDQIHVLHWDTVSYSTHKALNEAYDTWLDLTDLFIETYQGKYGRMSGHTSFETDTAIAPRDYLVSLMVFLNQDIVTIIDQTVDSDLDNIIADMKGLVNHTLYLLTLK